MTTFKTSEVFLVAPARAFGLFRRTAERIRLAPPALRLRLEEGPEVLQEGSRLTVCGRRWGVTLRMTTEITAFKEGALIVEEQRRGPFRSWKHTQRFEATPDGGVLITDAIEYEPPNGVLGRLATADAIRRELEQAFAYRSERLAEAFSEGLKGPNATD